MELTNKDYELIDFYRQRYCQSDYDARAFVPAREFLRPWAEAKSKYLFKIFGDKLQVEFPINLSLDKDAIMGEMEKYLLDDETYDLLRHYNVTEKGYKSRWADWDTVPLYDILRFTNLANKVTSRKFEFEDIKFPAGTKITRIVRKVNEVYNIVPKDELNDFFDRLSICFNQKLTGTYVLSIHPLDYMTMSDNASDWSSCMSWVDNGCYKRGTVEMMNSPCVVVGYVKSNHKDWTFATNRTWNNKKWRTLFIVDKNFITSVKGYPYYCPTLLNFGLNKLAEMTGLNKGKLIYFDENLYLDEDNDGTYYSDKDYISFYADGAMYNDFGATTHHAYVDILHEWTKEDKKFYRHFNYCGKDQCVICGKSNKTYIQEEGKTEGQLVCTDCAGICICKRCGGIWSNDEMEVVQGEYLCPNCVSELIPDDINPDFKYNVNDMYRIFIAKRTDDPKHPEISPLYFYTYSLDNLDAKTYRIIDVVRTKNNCMFLYFDRLVYYEDLLENDYNIDELVASHIGNYKPTELSYFNTLFVRF